MNLKHISTVLFLVSFTVFSQGFMVLKSIFLLFFLSTHFVDSCLKKRVVIYPRLIAFYCLLSLAGAFWSLIGIFNGGYIDGIMDCFKIYVIWSIVLIIVFTMLRADEETNLFHISIVISGILISLVNFYGVYDSYYGIGLISDDILKELSLYIGFNEGYIRIESQNIGMLFVIIPYLLSIQFRRDAGTQNTVLTKISLMLCLVLAIISGRRALWLCIVFTPIIILALSYILDSTYYLKAKGRLILKTYVCIAILVLGCIILLPENSIDAGFINHLKSAFSAEDARSIQKGYLIDSFMDSPYLGAGFGASVSYTRSETQPWLYELTYSLALLHFGIFGALYLIALIALCMYLVISSIKRNKSGSLFSFCILSAWFSLVIGAYSNPYLGSFDYLIYFGMLPYLSTYRYNFKKNLEYIQKGECLN